MKITITDKTEKFSALLDNQISVTDLFLLHTIEYLPKNRRLI